MSGRLRQLVLWALGRRRRYRIAGRSMLPTLLPGDQVWIDPRAYRRRRPRPGEVVIARHPYRSDMELVKRLERVLPDGRCVLRGDDGEESTDSRVFGPVPLALVRGRVLLRMRRAGGVDPVDAGKDQPPSRSKKRS